MNFGYTIYQAERTRTCAETREEDRRRGELAAALTRPWRRKRRGAAVHRASRREAHGLDRRVQHD
jgi:hypothetical protein